MLGRVAARAAPKTFQTPSLAPPSLFPSPLPPKSSKTAVRKPMMVLYIARPNRFPPPPHTPIPSPPKGEKKGTRGREEGGKNDPNVNTGEERNDRASSSRYRCPIARSRRCRRRRHCPHHHHRSPPPPRPPGSLPSAHRQRRRRLTAGQASSCPHPQQPRRPRRRRRRRPSAGGGGRRRRGGRCVLWMVWVMG